MSHPTSSQGSPQLNTTDTSTDMTTTTTTRQYTRKPVTTATLVEKPNFELASMDSRPSPEEIEVALNIVQRTIANYPLAVADAFLSAIRDELGVDTGEDSSEG